MIERKYLIYILSIAFNTQCVDSDEESIEFLCKEKLLQTHLTEFLETLDEIIQDKSVTAIDKVEELTNDRWIEDEQQAHQFLLHMRELVVKASLSEK